MALGRPRKNVEAIPGLGDAPEVTALKTGDKPKDEIGKKSGGCPWCNYSNSDEKKGPIHSPEKSVVCQVKNAYQCNTCGKHWRKEDIGKEWSLERERGPDWVRETQARRLRES